MEVTRTACSYDGYECRKAHLIGLSKPRHTRRGVTCSRLIGESGMTATCGKEGASFPFLSFFIDYSTTAASVNIRWPTSFHSRTEGTSTRSHPISQGHVTSGPRVPVLESQLLKLCPVRKKINKNVDFTTAWPKAISGANRVMIIHRSLVQWP